MVERPPGAATEPLGKEVAEEVGIGARPAGAEMVERDVVARVVATLALAPATPPMTGAVRPEGWAVDPARAGTVCVGAAVVARGADGEGLAVAVAAGGAAGFAVVTGLAGTGVFGGVVVCAWAGAASRVPRARTMNVASLGFAVIMVVPPSNSSSYELKSVCRRG